MNNPFYVGLISPLGPLEMSAKRGAIVVDGLIKMDWRRKEKCAS